MAASANAVMLGPWGRTGGKFWKHELPDPEAPYTIIFIRYGSDGINYINVESAYNWDNIQHHHQPPGPINISSIAVIPLGPDEYIKDYSFGFSPDAKYLSWLRFITNKNMYGPYGIVTTSEFSLPAPKSKLVGFFGWNEWPISSIGVELAPIDNEVKVGPWGLTDGGSWEHVIPDLSGRVSKIIIVYGARIDFITVESNEKLDINKDDIIAKAKRSAPGGDAKMAVISLDPDEFITEFFIYVEPDSKFLSALGFITNKKMYGPYGTITSSVFPVPVTKGKLLGFFGYNEVPINSIGFVFAP